MLLFACPGNICIVRQTYNHLIFSTYHIPWQHSVLV